MTALTFEQTYIKYPFAPLVGLALKICAYFIIYSTHKTPNTDVPNGMAHGI